LFSIEAWMQASKYREKGEYILMGHSLGGYLGVLYALKYP
jgi:pimeloyl-ACP methyl ester carboxylesterase